MEAGARQFGQNAVMKNPNIEIFELSAKNGDGFEAWENWLTTAILDWKK